MKIRLYYADSINLILNDLNILEEKPDITELFDLVYQQLLISKSFQFVFEIIWRNKLIVNAQYLYEKKLYPNDFFKTELEIILCPELVETITTPAQYLIASFYGETQLLDTYQEIEIPNEAFFLAFQSENINTINYFIKRFAKTIFNNNLIQGAYKSGNEEWIELTYQECHFDLVSAIIGAVAGDHQLIVQDLFLMMITHFIRDHDENFFELALKMALSEVKSYSMFNFISETLGYPFNYTSLLCYLAQIDDIKTALQYVREQEISDCYSSYLDDFRDVYKKAITYGNYEFFLKIYDEFSSIIGYEDDVIPDLIDIAKNNGHYDLVKKMEEKIYPILEEEEFAFDPPDPVSSL